MNYDGPRPWVKTWAEMITGLDTVAIRHPYSLLVRLVMHPLVYTSGTQTINGKAEPAVGWLLTGAGVPLPIRQFAFMCKLSDDAVQTAMVELIAAKVAVQSDQGAFGLVGWLYTQESVEARRTRKWRAKCDADVTATAVTSSSSSASPSASASSLSEGDQTQEIMDLWHYWRVELGLAKTRARARSANEGERKGLAVLPPDEMKTALRRMAERLRRDAERMGVPVFETEGAKYFTIEHLLRPKNRQRYLDAQDLDERAPQRPSSQKNPAATGSFKPERYTEGEPT